MGSANNDSDCVDSQSHDVIMSTNLKSYLGNRSKFSKIQFFLEHNILSELSKYFSIFCLLIIFLQYIWMFIFYELWIFYDFLFMRIKSVRLEKTIRWKPSNNHYGMSNGIIKGSLFGLESKNFNRKLLFRWSKIILNNLS